MPSEKYACRKCKVLFELPSLSYLEKGEEAKCPACGGNEVDQLPSWIPIGFNLDLYYSPSKWRYLCHQCNTTFESPVPSGPNEEEQRKCSACGSIHITRLTALVVEAPMYCS
jgi:rRNA maturation endonuclease Nob1